MSLALTECSVQLVLIPEDLVLVGNEQPPFRVRSDFLDALILEPFLSRQNEGSSELVPEPRSVICRQMTHETCVFAQNLASG